MILIVALWAFAEATLFFVVADVPISAIGIRYGFRRAALAALVAAPAAASGGLIMQAWAAENPELCWKILDHIPGIGSRLITSAASAYAVKGMPAMLWGSFQGVPYKLYAYSAALTGTAAVPFFLASITARLPRFLLVAAVSASLRPPLQRWLTPRSVAILFLIFWSLFYAAYFTMMAHD